MPEPRGAGLFLPMITSNTVSTLPHQQGLSSCFTGGETETQGQSASPEAAQLRWNFWSKAFPILASSPGLRGSCWRAEWGGSYPWSPLSPGAWELPPRIASAGCEHQSNVMHRENKWTLWRKRKMLPELIREFNTFLSPTPSSILNNLASVHSLPLNNLRKAFEIPICPAPQPAMFLVTS